jgi:predicted TIM-barrel fold metal-dependent hydrolase
MIDFHVHVASRIALPDFFFSGWAENVARAVRAADRDAAMQRAEAILARVTDDDYCDILIDEMNEAGIEQSVLLAIDFGGHAGKGWDVGHVEALHDAVAARHPGRFILFAGCDPRRGTEQAAALDEALRTGRRRGMKLYPPCGFSLADSALVPFYETCAAHRVPVVTHFGPTTPRLRFDFNMVGEIDRAAHDFPNVDFVIAHGGATPHEDLLLLAEYRANVHLEISGFQAAARRQEFVTILERCRRRGLVHKLLFGTDWPMDRLFGTQRDAVDTFRKAAILGGLTATDLLRIESENALELLRGWP